MYIKQLLIITLTIMSFVFVACAGGGMSNKANQPTVCFQPDWYGSLGIGDEIFFYGRAQSYDQDSAEEIARFNARSELFTFLSGWIVEVKGVTTGKSDTHWGYNMTALPRSMRYSNKAIYLMPDGSYEAFFQISINQSDISDLK